MPAGRRPAPARHRAGSGTRSRSRGCRRGRPAPRRRRRRLPVPARPVSSAWTAPLRRPAGASPTQMVAPAARFIRGRAADAVRRGSTLRPDTRPPTRHHLRMTDLRRPHRAPARRSSASSRDLASPLGGGAVRQRGLRLDLPRSRARQRRPRPTSWGCSTRWGDTPPRDRPTAIGRAAAHRSGPGPRAPPGSCSPSCSRPTRSARRSTYLRYPPVGLARRRAADPGRRHGRARSRRRRTGRQRTGRRHRPDRIAGRRSRTPTRSRRSTRWTSCSSARPTCRMRSASRASSTTRPTSPRCERVVAAAAPRQGRRHPPLRHAALARHLELGFRSSGWVPRARSSARARAMLAAAGRA